MAKEVKKTKMTPRRILEIFYEVILAPDDRPDINEFTDDQVDLELKENVDQLTPEDEEQFLKIDGGEEALKFLKGLMKGLSVDKMKKQMPPEQPKPKKEEERSKPSQPAERKPSATNRAMQILCDSWFTDDSFITTENVQKKLDKEGLSLSKTSIDSWRADLIKIMNYLSETKRFAE